MIQNGYRFLEERPESRYRQLYVKGRKYAAERIYRETVGEDPRTPEEVARDFNLPLEAVLEAIDYSTKNVDLLSREREQKLQRIAEFEKRHPPILPDQSNHEAVSGR